MNPPRDGVALVVVDTQRDFLPGGSLPVPDGDQVVPLINRLMEQVPLVVATQDWHPPNHCSFAANHPGHEIGDTVEVAGLPQFLWPVHCVQDTDGARLSPDLNVHPMAAVFRKGTDPLLDSYSGFYDNAHRLKTGLTDFLRQHGIERILIAGLATDYCVKHTALDALGEGFAVQVIEDACRGIDQPPGSLADALHQIRAAGGEIITSEIILNRG
jgi:nicotinamidase/pyrazinamidase